jgi:hypothetical protein
MISATLSEQLNDKGYVVVQNFLNKSDISQELIDWLDTAPKFKDGVISDLPVDYLLPIKNKVAALIPALANQLAIAIHPEQYAYSAIKINKSTEKPQLRLPFDLHRDPKIYPGGVLNWHLDHFSYYLLRDHINYLICYLPVKKPLASKSNIAIIPYDILRKLDIDSFNKIKYRGAMRFRCVEEDTKPWFETRFTNETFVIGDWFAIDDFFPDHGWKMNIDLEAEKVIPPLAEGDLLIMRADVIHKTQDADIDRISIRCDAIPLNVKNFTSWFGLIRIFIKLYFEPKKVRYNLTIWLEKVLRKKLANMKF